MALSICVAVSAKLAGVRHDQADLDRGLWGAGRGPDGDKRSRARHSDNRFAHEILPLFDRISDGLVTVLGNGSRGRISGQFSLGPGGWPTRIGSSPLSRRATAGGRICQFLRWGITSDANISIFRFVNSSDSVPNCSMVISLPARVSSRSFES